jgi:hypothetical protein
MEYVPHALSRNSAKRQNTHSSWYRTFQICGDATLEQLSFTILQILDWEKDHLYEFRVHDRTHTNFGTTEQFVYADETCLSCDIPIRLLGLSARETFLFIFEALRDNS